MSVQFICTAFKRRHVLIGVRYTHLRTLESVEVRAKDKLYSQTGSVRVGEKRGKDSSGDNGILVGIFTTKYGRLSRVLSFSFFFFFFLVVV